MRIIDGPVHEVEKEANILLEGIDPENLVSVGISTQKQESWEAQARPVLAIPYIEGSK